MKGIHHTGKTKGGDLQVHHKIPLSRLILVAMGKFKDREQIIQQVLDYHTLDLGITVNTGFHLNNLHKKRARMIA